MTIKFCVWLPQDKKKKSFEQNFFFKTEAYPCCSTLKSWRNANIDFVNQCFYYKYVASLVKNLYCVVIYTKIGASAIIAKLKTIF